MKQITQLLTGLEERWQELTTGHWRCKAQKRFETTRLQPMQAQMEALNGAADRLEAACQAAQAVAAAVREPEDGEKGDFLWNTDSVSE